MMQDSKTSQKTWTGCGSKKLMAAVVLLLLNGCSAHQNGLSSSNMPSVKLENGLNRETSDKFWSGVKPVSNLSAAHYKLGRYYQKSGKHQLAIEEFTKAIELNGEYILAYNGLGVSYDALKDCENAEKAYGKAIHYGPDLAYLYNNLGCSRLLCSDPEHALVYLNKAAKLDATTPRIHNNLLLAEVRFQQFPNKKEQLGTVPPAQPTERQEPPGLTAQPSQVALTQSHISILPLQAVASMSAEGKAPPLEGSGAAETEPNDQPALAAGEQKMGKTSESKVAPDNGKQSITIQTVTPLQGNKHPGTAVEKGSPKFSHCPIEITNGNGVTGMAGKSADYLRNHGFTVGRITNAPHFNHGSSKIYYQEGFLDVAKAIAALVPGPQKIEQEKVSGRVGTGVRLLLGKDMAAIRFPKSLAHKSNEHGKQGNPMDMVANVD